MIWSRKEKKEGSRYRYFVLGVACMCLTSISSNMLSFNFAIICMSPRAGSNYSTTHHDQTFHYTQNEKSTLMWAVAAGSIIGTFPFNWFFTHFGARYVFLSAGLTTALATLSIPIAASIGLWAFAIARFFQGVAFSANFSGIGLVASRWAPLKQIGLFLAVLTSFTPISSLLTNPISGILCTSLGWPSVYYAHAGASILLFTLWWMCYTDKPEEHKCVSVREVEKIHADKTVAQIKMDSFVPYWEICKNPVILTVWFNAFANIGTSSFLLMYSPTYFNNVLKFGIAQTGFLGMTICLNLVFKWTTGYLSDAWNVRSEKLKMKAFNSFALLVPASLYIGLGFVPAEHPWVAYCMTVIIQICTGANCGGFYRCGTLVGRQYGHFIVANIQFIKCITLFTAPALMSIFVQDDTSKDQWRHVFLVNACILISANTLFCFMATDKPAEFTKIVRKTNQEKKVYEAVETA